MLWNLFLFISQFIFFKIYIFSIFHILIFDVQENVNFPQKCLAFIERISYRRRRCLLWFLGFGIECLYWLLGFDLRRIVHVWKFLWFWFLQFWIWQRIHHFWADATYMWSFGEGCYTGCVFTIDFIRNRQSGELLCVLLFEDFVLDIWINSSDFLFGWFLIGLSIVYICQISTLLLEIVFVILFINIIFRQLEGTTSFISAPFTWFIAWS